MPLIKLSTTIQAPINICFDISRDISAHINSMEHTNERAIAGRISGLCEEGDAITWEAVHFGIKQRLSVRVIKIDFPFYFEDIMIKGAFNSMRHKHFFSDNGTTTLMRDEFFYESPLGILGKLADRLFLKRYMTSLLIRRNNFIKSSAEEIGLDKDF